MPTAVLIAALLAAAPALELAVDAAPATALQDGARPLLVVTVRNTSSERVVVLPRALAVTFSAPGARLQAYDEGPALPPVALDARVLAPGASTRVSLAAMWTDARAWQVAAGGGRRANWLLNAPGRYTAVVKYAVPDAPAPEGVALPAALLWTGVVTAAPIALELAPPPR